MRFARGFVDSRFLGNGGGGLKRDEREVRFARGFVDSAFVGIHTIATKPAIRNQV